jgi:hypothetical protein
VVKSRGALVTSVIGKASYLDRDGKSKTADLDLDVRQPGLTHTATITYTNNGVVSRYSGHGLVRSPRSRQVVGAFLAKTGVFAFSYVLPR